MKRNRRSPRLILRALAVFAGAAGVSSGTAPAVAQQADQVFVQRAQVASPMMPPVEIGFESFGAIVPSKVVKGAPYSAVASTERTQLLSDGNQINHKFTSNIYRDSQGRTRREENFSGIGLLAINGKQARGVVFLSDPVSGADYVLEPENKTARRMPSLPANGITTNKIFAMGIAVQGSGDPGVQSLQVSGHAGVQNVRTPEDLGVQVSPEPLGQQTIEGVVADGKRTTTTIPAGAMGNQRPITTVTEEWFSPDLQVIVLSTTKDPRMGETTYRLTNIQRAEPPATLFTLPADYTVKEFDKPEFFPRPPQNNE
jgi:hypothetical protein